MTKLLVCGSRSIADLEIISAEIEDLISEKQWNKSEITLISGGAKGVDSLAEQWAGLNNVPVEMHKPDWKKYGRGAGIVRNRQMVEACDFCLIFWDGVSKGTKSDIEFCEKLEKNHRIIRIEKHVTV